MNIIDAVIELLNVPGQPQTVLRVGHGHPAVRAPRRPVSAAATTRTEVPS